MCRLVGALVKIAHDIGGVGPNADEGKRYGYSQAPRVQTTSLGKWLIANRGISLYRLDLLIIKAYGTWPGLAMAGGSRDGWR